MPQRHTLIRGVDTRHAYTTLPPTACRRSQTQQWKRTDVMLCDLNARRTRISMQRPGPTTVTTLVYWLDFALHAKGVGNFPRRAGTRGGS